MYVKRDARMPILLEPSAFEEQFHKGAIDPRKFVILKSL